MEHGIKLHSWIWNPHIIKNNSNFNINSNQAEMVSKCSPKMWPKNRLCHMNLSTFMWPFCEYTFYDAAVRKRFRVVAIVSSHTFVCWSCCWNILEWEMASFECKETNYKSFVDFWQRDTHFMYEMNWVLINGLLALRPSYSSSFNNRYSQQH